MPDPQYCVYQAGTRGQNLNPAINVGDTVCVDCPEDGNCKSSGRIRLKDRNGTIQTVQLTQNQSNCRECPEGGKTGYAFAGPGSLY